MSSTQLLFNPMTGLFDLVTKPSASVEDLSDRMNTLEAKYVRTTRFTTVGSGTSGQSTVAFGGTVVLDDFGGGVDALVTAIENGVPKHINVYTAQGALITTSFDSLGNYVLSGVPAAYPVAVIYRIRTPLIHFDDTDPDIAGGTDLEEIKWVRRNITAANSPFSPESVNGVIYSVDLTGGSVVINLPAVNTSIDGHECIIYIERAGTGNYLDVICNGTQTIRGATSQRLTTVRDGFTLVAHTYLTNHWDAPDWAKPIKGDTQIEGLTNEGPIQSATIAVVIQEIGHSISETGRSGFTEWTGSGLYWSWTSGNPATFTLLRGGEGYVRYKEVKFLGGQSVSIAADELAFIYIDTNGTLGKSLTNSAEDKRNRINLFIVQNDINNEFFVLRNEHLFTMDAGARQWIDLGFGTVLSSAPGAANISRYGLGTGASTTDRMVNIASGSLIDADVVESWSAVTTGVTINHTYRRTDGKFARDVRSQQFPMKYNLNGTPTALNNGQLGVFRLFMIKSALNDSPPQFVSEMHTTVFGNATAAQTAIANGTISNFGAFDNELAQVGYVTVSMNAAGGFVSAVQVEKTTFRTVTGGSGVGSTASNVVTSTANFDKLLSPTDTTVQQALETIDEQAVSVANAQDITGIKTFAANAAALTQLVKFTNASVGTSAGSRLSLEDGVSYFRMIFPNLSHSDSVFGQTGSTIAAFHSDRNMAFVVGTATGNSQSFFWTFGTTALARLYQTAGTARLFVGNGNIPDASLHVNTGNVDLVNVKLSNQGTGRSTTRGFDMRLEAGGNSSIWLYENNYVTLGTNNAERMRILSTGQVGVNNTAPKSQLHVTGGIQMADDAAAASSDKAGCLRYRVAANNSYIDMCMQTAAATWAWVNIKTNTW